MHKIRQHSFCDLVKLVLNVRFLYNFTSQMHKISTNHSFYTQLFILFSDGKTSWWSKQHPICEMLYCESLKLDSWCQDDPMTATRSARNVSMASSRSLKFFTCDWCISCEALSHSTMWMVGRLGSHMIYICKVVKCTLLIILVKIPGKTTHKYNKTLFIYYLRHGL